MDRLASKRTDEDRTQVVLKTDGAEAPLWKAPEMESAHSIGSCPVMFGPNISGSFGASDGANASTDNTGPFWLDHDAGGRTGWGGDGGAVFGFDVSRSNALYGETNTVQPASVRFMPLIKI